MKKSIEELLEAWQATHDNGFNFFVPDGPSASDDSPADMAAYNAEIEKLQRSSKLYTPPATVAIDMGEEYCTSPFDTDWEPGK